MKAGFCGKHPSPQDLDSNSDLRMTTDFRRVYATMIGEWMGHKDTKSILQGEYQMLGMFA